MPFGRRRLRDCMAGDVERHLLRVDLFGIAGTVLAGHRSAPDDLFQVIADTQRRILHHLAVGAIEHGDVTVGAVDADAVRDGLHDGVQHGSAAARLIFSAGQRTDIGHRHCPPAVGQWIRTDVEHLAVATDAADGHWARAVGVTLAGDECLAVASAELVARRPEREQVGKADAGLQALGWQTEQFGEARIAEQQRTV